MALLLAIPALLLMPILAGAVMRSAWGRGVLAYACIGLATALPLWIGGFSKYTEQARAQQGSERDTEPKRDNSEREAPEARTTWPTVAFRIAADPQMDQEQLATYRLKLDQDGPGEDDTDEERPLRWFAVKSLDQYLPRNRNEDRERLETLKRLLSRSQSDDPREQAEAREKVEAMLAALRDVVARPHKGRLYLLLHNNKDHALIEHGDWAILNPRRGTDDLDRPTIQFDLDGRGAMRMRSMTESNIGRPLAFVYDGQVLTAPTIQSALSQTIQISGDFSEKEVSDLLEAIQQRGSGRSP